MSSPEIGLMKGSSSQGGPKVGIKSDFKSLAYVNIKKILER